MHEDIQFSLLLFSCHESCSEETIDILLMKLKSRPDIYSSLNLELWSCQISIQSRDNVKHWHDRHVRREATSLCKLHWNRSGFFLPWNQCPGWLQADLEWSYVDGTGGYPLGPTMPKNVCFFNDHAPNVWRCNARLIVIREHYVFDPFLSQTPSASILSLANDYGPQTAVSLGLCSTLSTPSKWWKPNKMLQYIAIQ